MMAIKECPVCAGMGYKVTRLNKRKNGTISSVSMSLKDFCDYCGGSGKVKWRGNVAYSLSVPREALVKK